MSVRSLALIRPLARPLPYHSTSIGTLSAAAVTPAPRSRALHASRRQAVDAQHVGKQSKQNREDESKAGAHDADKAQRAPWHREGADLPPARRARSAGAMTKGKLLTTPSRLLKLVVPLTTEDANDDRKNAEPLALLVHPQQPLSYLERLIQAELPAERDDAGNEKLPGVLFKAQSSTSDEMRIGSKGEGKGKNKSSNNSNSNNSNSNNKTDSSNTRSADSASGAPEHFVRWSASTEIGDFIRDAASGSEFAVIISSPHSSRTILVAVPSFLERTQYLRQRLRRAGRSVARLASVKDECDALARKGAQRVAAGGFGALAAWWLGVYYLTFKTELGWDAVEPVTYLAGLGGLMAGYLWFLRHNREASYRSAMNLTVSRRQARLYADRGFDPDRWYALLRDANALRAEIKAVAADYDADWDEREDEDVDEKASRALREQRRSERGEKKGEDGEGEDESPPDPRPAGDEGEHGKEKAKKSGGGEKK